MRRFQKHGENRWPLSGPPPAIHGNICRTTLQYSIPHYGVFSAISVVLCGFVDQSSSSGTWAGSAGSWGSSCQASTGYGTCTQYVQNQGNALANACEFRINQSRGWSTHCYPSPLLFSQTGRSRASNCINRRSRHHGHYSFASLCLPFHSAELQLTIGGVSLNLLKFLLRVYCINYGRSRIGCALQTSRLLASISQSSMWPCPLSSVNSRIA